MLQLAAGLMLFGFGIAVTAVGFLSTGNAYWIMFSLGFVALAVGAYITAHGLKVLIESILK